MSNIKGHLAAVLNPTFNNMSVILWQSVLLVWETGVHGEKYRHVASLYKYHASLFKSTWTTYLTEQ